MQAAHLTRRGALLLPLILASCGEEPPPAFKPLRYNYLPPIQLNVASIAIEQRFVPAGVPPDVSSQDPVPPVVALKAMASDRLQAFGTSGKAVFAILDASLTRVNDDVNGSMDVSLTVVDDNGAQLGFADARVQARQTGPISDWPSTLYDMTKSMMSNMNIEFEYQIRHNLSKWLTGAAAPDTPVEQAPLDQPSSNPPGPNPSMPNQPESSGTQPSGFQPSEPAPGQPSPEDPSLR